MENDTKLASDFSYLVISNSKIQKKFETKRKKENKQIKNNLFKNNKSEEITKTRIALKRKEAKETLSKLKFWRESLMKNSNQKIITK